VRDRRPLLVNFNESKLTLQQPAALPVDFFFVSKVSIWFIKRVCRQRWAKIELAHV